MAPVDVHYWNRVAADYDGEIFNSFASDRTGILTQRLDEFADPKAKAADAGCGVGKYLPALSSRFAHVDAYDHSAGLLRLARSVAKPLPNVRCFQRDFTSKSAKLPRVSFALCANVLIMADTTLREAILRSVARLVRRHGHALFLVPSLESTLLVHRRMVEWNRSEGMSPEEAERASIAPAAQSRSSLAAGLIKIEKVPTKHYLREEAILSLRSAGFECLHTDKVEYAWDTEFDSPPAWMRDPFPWDWLLSAQRI